MAETYQEIVEEFQKTRIELQLDIFISFEQLENGIKLCHYILQRLKRLVILKDFQNSREEIRFFKSLKPKPESYLFYLYMVRSFKLLMPHMDTERKLHFINKEIRKVNKFYKKNREFIYYMNQNFIDLDDCYFTRKTKITPIKIKKAQYRNIDFSTSYDMLWARIKAMDLYTKFIGEEHCIIKKQLTHHTTSSIVENKPLRWTASKTALIELVYALYTNGAINYGKEDLKSIANLFEGIFDTKLGNLYKTYSEMKARKGHRARFLQELAADLQDKMFDDDAF